MNARETVQALGGRWHGSYGLAFCPAHDNRRTPALSVRDGREGRLLATCFAGCSFEEIAAALRAHGLGGLPEIDPAKEAARRQAEEADRRRRYEQARTTWREAVPIGGTLAETYLRRRGILIELPASLRFHAACWHGPTAKRLPAVIAIIRDCTGNPTGVHRTYLHADGDRIGRDSKRMLGRSKGGAVRLGEIGEIGSLAACEGIETGLSAMQLGSPPAWAALSTAGMEAVELPEEARVVTILADADDPGEAAAVKLADRLNRGGRHVTISRPAHGKDFNDELRQSNGL